MNNKFSLKKTLYILGGLVLIITFISTINYLIKSNSDENQEFLTKTPTLQDIEDKVMATGKIIPREEVEVKPNISGIIEKIYVKEGDKVVEGQLIATLKIVPNIQSVNIALQEVSNAQLQVDNQKIILANQQKQFDMQQKLYNQGVISKQEFLTAQQQLYTNQQQVRNAQQQLATAQKSLQIAKTGSTPELKSMATTQIRAKSSGTVLEIPVKIGDQVIEANSFNSGTTIASIADLNTLVFQGTIDEVQVGKIREGMEMNFIIGALQNKKFSGKLTLIAPKGKDENGTIKFPIEGSVSNDSGEYIRAGFSANGEIILKSQKNTLLLDESLIQYEKQGGKDIAFVEVKQANGTFNKVFVKLGASDGINVQIISGIDKNAEIKVWNPNEKDKELLKEKK